MKQNKSKAANKPNDKKPTDASKKVDRPGFDLGGSTGKARAGRGLGLGTDTKEDPKGQHLPRK